jgi:hypothetical protein
MTAFWGAYLATLTTVQVVMLAYIAARYAKSTQKGRREP